MRQQRLHAQASILATHVCVLYTNRLGPSFHPLFTPPNHNVKMDALYYLYDIILKHTKTLMMRTHMLCGREHPAVIVPWPRQSVCWARMMNISQKKNHVLNVSRGPHSTQHRYPCHALVSSHGNRKPALSLALIGFRSYYLSSYLAVDVYTP